MLEFLKKLLALLQPKQKDVKLPTLEVKKTSFAWGSKVSPKFRSKVNSICHDIEMDRNYLMACIAFESGETFSPSIKNAAGSGATGLIQFMPRTAKGLGTTTTELAKMSAEDQLDYVHKYFKPYKGRIKTLSDVYMAILWPAAIGKPEEYVLWSKSAKPTTYSQNAGLDTNKDGKITKAEAASKIYAKLEKGLKDPFVLFE